MTAKLPWYDADGMRRLILRVQHGVQVLNGTELTGFQFPAKAAGLLIRASINAGVRNVVLGGQVNGDLRIDGAVRNLYVEGKVVGDLIVEGKVVGDLIVEGEVTGDLHVRSVATVMNLAVSGTARTGKLLVSNGAIVANVCISDRVQIGVLWVAGDVLGALSVVDTVEIETLGLDASAGVGLLSVGGKARIEHLSLSGAVNGSVHLAGGTRFGVVAVLGDVRGRTIVQGAVTEALFVDSSATLGDLFVLAPARIENLYVAGTVTGAVKLSGTIDGRVSLMGRANGPLNLSSVSGAKFGDEVVVGEFVSIEKCDFGRCPDLDRLNLVGSFAQLFPSGNGLTKPQGGGASDELATVNRQLRANLEGRRNRPASSIFYEGEMDARRQAAWKARRIPEWFVLWAYWLMSGYGLKAWRPVAWFAIVAAAGSVFFAVTDVQDPVLFAVRSMVAFFSPPNAPSLSGGQQWVQLGLRFAGPILLAQAILAVRERVAR